MKIKNTCPKCGHVEVREQKFIVRCWKGECKGVEMTREKIEGEVKK